MDADKEEWDVRRLLVGGAFFCVVSLVGMILLCTVLIATGFNVLSWLE